MMDATEIFTIQQDIIDLQSKAIRDLSLRLMQLIPQEESENIANADAEKIAKLKALIGDF